MVRYIAYLMSALEVNPLDFAQELDFQQILTNPILDIAARVWEDERYDAFRTCYRSMRIIDDLIDTRKATGVRISDAEKQRYSSMVNDWVEAVNSGNSYDPSRDRLAQTRARFQIPSWPWQKLSESMIYDLHHDGFRAFPVFLRYSEGAAVAPASVFMHLCGVVKRDGRYHPPPFDARKAARPLALFSYLVHIIRDFQKDQKNNLNYFSDNLLAENGLDVSALREVAEGGKISRNFRNLMEKYYSFAEYYRRRARQSIDRVYPDLKPRYRLSLEIVYGLYLHVFERIDVLHGRFATAELNPPPDEVQQRITEIISSFEPAE